MKMGEGGGELGQAVSERLDLFKWLFGFASLAINSKENIGRKKFEKEEAWKFGK